MKRLRITVEGKAYEVEVEFLDEGTAEARPVSRPKAASARASVPVAAAPAPKPAVVAAGAGEVVAPLSAVVVAVQVAPGASVTEGQTIIVLEAMKMNTNVTAPVSGTVGAVHIKVGDAVEEGQALLSIQ